MKRVFMTAIGLIVSTYAIWGEGLGSNRANLLFDGGTNALLATKNTFRIVYNDEVTGGCLPKPKRLRDTMEAALRRNGIEITTQGSDLNDTIVLSALGFRAGPNYCAVSLTAKLKTWVAVEVPYSEDVPSGRMTFVPYVYTIGHYLLTGKRGSMQRRLEKVAREMGDKTFTDIARARHDIFSRFPSIERRFESNGRKNGSLTTP